jgi:HPt (histidine-containing phosphotransfer) domain-containing protein
MYDGASRGIGQSNGEALTAALDAHSVPVDRCHLARYTLGDPSLEKEVLGLFLAKVPLTIESLKFASTDKDWHMAAHALKGSARAVGAWKLARLAQQAERFGRNGEGGLSGGIVSRIEDAAFEVESYLATSVPGLRG